MVEQDSRQIEAFTDADFKTLRWISRVCATSGKLFASKPYMAGKAEVSPASVQRTLDKAVARGLLIPLEVSHGRKGSQYKVSPRLVEVVTGQPTQPTQATDSQPTQDSKGSPPYYPPLPKRGGEEPHQPHQGQTPESPSALEATGRERGPEKPVEYFRLGPWSPPNFLEFRHANQNRSDDPPGCPQTFVFDGQGFTMQAAYHEPTGRLTLSVAPDDGSFYFAFNGDESTWEERAATLHDMRLPARFAKLSEWIDWQKQIAEVRRHVAPNDAIAA
jgi:hypothetical protein